MRKEIDTHVHTKKYSSDSALDIEELVKVIGNRNICITEHMDYGVYVKEDKKFCVESYFKDYAKYRGNQVFLGIEIGMNTGYDEIFALEAYDFDYMLGSVHGVEGEELYHNPGYYRCGKSEAYKRYFSYAVKCLNKFSFVDAFAHFDCVARYAPYEDSIPCYEEFKQEYEQLFEALVKNNILLEINTKQLIPEDGLLQIMQHYFRAGGCYVTLGSDAHGISGIFKDFSRMEEIILEAGLKRACFIQRELVPLDESLITENRMLKKWRQS